MSSSLSCRSPSGTCYKTVRDNLEEIGACGRTHVIKVFVSINDGQSWKEIPLKQAWRSIIFGGIFASWPPDRVDHLYCEDELLCMEFRDEWIPYEKPVLPFGLDTESLWKAIYMPQARLWRLRRLRVLDYDGADKPGRIMVKE